MLVLHGPAKANSGTSGLPNKRPNELKARQEIVIDEYFGHIVSDPYRWMESGKNNPEFLDYLKQQSSYTESLLASIGKPREKLLARIRELDSGSTHIGSWRRCPGGKILALELEPGASVYQLVLHQAEKKKVLLNPATSPATASGSAAKSIDYFSASFDGKYVLAAVSEGGSENSSIYIIDTESGNLLPEKITRAQYAYPSWRSDCRSFFYSRLQKLAPGSPETAIHENQKVYLHKLNEDPENDAAVFGPGLNDSAPVPKAGFSGILTDPTSKFVLAYHSAGTSDAQSYYLATEEEAISPNCNWKRIISPADALTGMPAKIALFENTLYMLVEDRPNRRILSLDLNNFQSEKKLVFPVRQRLLLGIHAAADALYITSRDGMAFFLERLSYDASPQAIEEIKLPYPAYISGIESSRLLPGVMIRLESWTRCPSIYNYDPAKELLTETSLQVKDPADFAKIETRELNATSADGTLVPVSVICLKGMKLDGTSPTLLVGYGSYGISIDPYFDATLLAWLERGAVVAIAHPRGGGEYGPSWHRAGKSNGKRKTIEDMLAAAEFLIDKKYTSKQKLALRGTSAGAIACAVAACRRPDLFAALIDNVGLTDMLRFGKTQSGAANIPEFGDLKNEADFLHLYDMSAYYQLKPGLKYPATLGIAGLNDPRVPAWMVAKMIARLQEINEAPALLRADSQAGHGFGSSREQRQKQKLDERSFLLWRLGDPEFQIKEPFRSGPAG